MGAVFLKLLNMSIAAVWLILAVLVLRFLLKKAPKWISCVLWGLAAIRLICPFSIESGLSLIPSAEALPVNIISENSFQVHTGIGAIDAAMNEYLGGRYYEGVAVSAGNGSRVLTVLGILWLAGMAVLLFYGVISYLRLQKRVRTAIPFEENILLCDCINTPFILGIFRPRIYLPSDLPPDKQAHVLIHERAHLKRHDHWWKPLGFLLLTVHWFNPFIWIAYILLCRDIELACDEKVVRNFSIEDKKAYSKALLSLSISRRRISACPLAFGEIGVKERIRSVLNYKKPAFWVIAVAVIACIVAAVCFLTNPVSGDGPDGSVTFRASVIEVENGYLLVEPVEGSPELSSADRISVAILNMPSSPEPEAGDVVEITYDGMIMESYPAQLGQVYGIRVMEDKEALLNDRIPMVMVDDTLFFDTGNTTVTKCGTYDGEITSTVDSSQVPVKNNQSNFGKRFGYLYAEGSDTVLVHINDTWAVFKASSETDTQIRFHDQWFLKADLSEETLEWLDWYNAMPEHDQLAISYIPSDLLPITVP